MRRIASWDRGFDVWHYSFSYSQLLLRSVQDESPTRIDVLFSNVKLLHLVPQLAGLQIDVVEDRSYAGVEMPASEKGNWYVLNGGNSYVFATQCQWHEDEGTFSSPSKYGPLRRTD